jgi:hypothetical protein
MLRAHQLIRPFESGEDTKVIGVVGSTLSDSGFVKILPEGLTSACVVMKVTKGFSSEFRPRAAILRPGIISVQEQ